MARPITPAQPAPILPLAPAEYDQRYMQKLVSALEGQLRQLQQPRNIAVSAIMTFELPTSVTGLRTGEVYSDGGILKVAP